MPSAIARLGMARTTSEQRETNARTTRGANERCDYQQSERKERTQFRLNRESEWLWKSTAVNLVCWETGWRVEEENFKRKM